MSGFADVFSGSEPDLAELDLAEPDLAEEERTCELWAGASPISARTTNKQTILYFVMRNLPLERSPN